MRIGTAYIGVLGISPLVESPDLVNSVPVDYMDPLLGDPRMLINLEFNLPIKKVLFIWAIRPHK